MNSPSSPVLIAPNPLITIVGVGAIVGAIAGAIVGAMSCFNYMLAAEVTEESYKDNGINCNDLSGLCEKISDSAAEFL